MIAKRYTYVSSFADRHGKVRHRFRRAGYPTYYFKSPFGTKDFDREYAACMEAEPAAIGVELTIPGSVSDVIARYYNDISFLKLSPSTQKVYRGVLERFRANFGRDQIRIFDAERVGRLMTAMRHKPHAAARLRKLLSRLFRVARIAKLVPPWFNPIPDTIAPDAETKGYHRWTEEELAQFERTHPLGTKARLTYELLLFSAQRSSDVRLMPRAMLAGGRIQLDQSKTNNAVDIPIVAPLQAALDAGPTGEFLILETKDGEAYTPKGFYNMFKEACIKAGLPHCSAHGVRKSAARRCYLAGCTDEEGMEITGHKTLAEYRRYAGITARPEVADAAMAKVMANRPAGLAKGGAHQIENNH